MLKVFEAFTGVGSIEMALNNVGIPHEVVAIAEIDKFAIKSHEAIHGETHNLGDISQLKTADIPDHDLFTYSFPCQDISVAGKGAGLSEGSGTRSGLLWECQKVITAKKPKYLLLENVKNLVGRKHKPNFDLWLEWLEGQGYSNYWKVLNAKDFGIPQNRERVFVISILGEHEPYVFPEPFGLKARLKDVLEETVEEKYYLSETMQKRLTLFPSDRLNGSDIEVLGTTSPNPRNKEGDLIYDKCTSSWVYNTEKICGALAARDYKQPKQILVKNNTEKGFLVATEGDGIDISFPSSTTRRGRVQKESSQTLQTSSTVGTLDGYRIRKLTPLECWRLMGFKDLHFFKAQEVNSNSQLYKQAGNSIVVPVLEGLFTQLFLANTVEQELAA